MTETSSPESVILYGSSFSYFTGNMELYLAVSQV